MRLPATARTRSPAVRMPVRLSGSAALMTISLPSGVVAADLAQALDRLGQRELFAAHAGDEAAAADLAARFEPAVDARQLAPRRGVRLAREQAAEDDAVAAEEHARLHLDRVVGICASPVTMRPASGEVRRARVRVSTSARRPAKPSEAIRPAETSSPSGLAGRRSRSRANEAPRVRSVSSTRRARGR